MPRGKRPEGAKVIAGDQRCAALQLRKLLRLENNLPIFEEIRNNIRFVAREYLDINETMQRQTKAIENVRKELVERFPDLFNAEDKERRLNLATKMIQVQHNSTRHRERNKKQNMPMNDGNARRRSSRRLSAHPGVSSVKVEKPPADNHRRPAYQDYIIPTNFSEPASSSQQAGSSQNSENQCPPATPACRRTPGILISNAVQTPARIPFTLSRPLSTATPRPKTPNTPRPNAQRGLPGREQDECNDDGHQPRGKFFSVPPSPRAFKGEELKPDTEAVYNFLDNCTPSMVRFFEGFVEYGCNTEEFLLGISDWPPNLIANFIRKVAHKSGEYISDMEADVLQTRFMTCYSTR